MTPQKTIELERKWKVIAQISEGVNGIFLSVYLDEKLLFNGWIWEK